MDLSSTIKQCRRRTNHYYRAFGNRSNLTMMGCGFLEKKAGVRTRPKYNHYALVYLLSGEGFFTDDSGTRHELRPGTVFQRFPNEKHELFIENKGDWLEAFIALHHCRPTETYTACDGVPQENWINEIDQFPSLTMASLELMGLTQERQIFHPGLQLNIIHQFQAIYAKIGNPSNRNVQQIHFTILALLNSLAESSANTESKEEALVKQMCELLQENYDGRVPLPELFCNFGLSYSRLRSLFKNVMTVSPGNYLLQYRIDQAEKLLRQGGSVKAVATQLGYTSGQALSLQFRKFRGITPGSLIPKSKSPDQA